MANTIQAAVGIILLLVVVGGLLFIYYSRTNAVQKTGYGTLIMLLAVSLMIPVFWIMEGQKEASAQADQFRTAVTRGAALYGQYCTYSCFGIDDSNTDNIKVVKPTYNGYSMKDLQSLTDDDLNRIIGAGIFKSPSPASPPPANTNLIPKSETYGGVLLSNDIDYLRDFLRSTDKTYLTSHGYPQDVKPFNELVAYLQANATTQYNEAVTYFKNGAFGAPEDLTTQNTVDMQIQDVGQAGVSCPSATACFSKMNIKVKVGTTLTWTNQSKVEHTVTAVEGTSLASPKAASDLFDSKLFGTGKTFTLTVTDAMYNAGTATASDPNAHQLYYYCTIHPDMQGSLIIVK